MDAHLSPARVKLLALISTAILALAFAAEYLLRQPATPPAPTMAGPQISDIRAQLVTADNPARDTDALDHQRCARLHNFLVEYGWVAGGRELADLERRSFFERYGEEADEIRERLDPSLTAFLDAIYDVEGSTFFFWVEGITPPSDMWANHLDVDQEDGGGGSSGNFLTLYATNSGLGEHGDGLTYDQTSHRATMALGIEDQGFAQPVEEHRELWYPLETILSHWIQMIELGKITASPDDAENEKYGPWIWHSYSEAQVDSTVAAFHQLVEAIESRMPAASVARAPTRDAPLFSDGDLDAASIPASCFVRQFLLRVRVPRFSFIAPGLLVPHDRSAFISAQAFTMVDTSSEDGVVIPPVLLFRATDRTANFDSDNQYKSLNPFSKPYNVPRGHHSVPAGLYSESVRRYEVDNAEDGFRLVLPYAVGGVAAKKSDGQRLEEGVVADLFQHGFKPFGGEWWRAQRLERLFAKWTELVERGVWQVDDDGVVGNVETFRDADSGRWRDYYIEPDW